MLLFLASYQIYIVLSGLIAVLFLIITLKTKNKISIIFVCIFSVLFVFILFFFRNPARNIIINSNYILSPCDGKVLSIKQTGDNRTQILVFLSIFDVHRFRNPISGKISEINYHKGKYHPAYDKKAVAENEYNEVIFVAENGEIVRVRQIAGLIARRIYSYIKKDDIVTQGNLYGLISFGSASLIDIPANYTVKIDKKSRVKGGETIIAERNQ